MYLFLQISKIIHTFTIINNTKTITMQQEIREQLKESIQDFRHKALLDRSFASNIQEFNLSQQKQEQTIELLGKETEAAVSRFNAAQQGFSESLLAMSNQENLVKIAESLSVQNLIGGKNFMDVISKLFNGSPMEEAMSTIMKRSNSRETN